MPPLQLLDYRPALPQLSRAESITAGHIVLMGNSALFAGIPPAQCREIASAARPRVFGCDEILFMQGHPVRTHVLIQAGNVKVTQVSPGGCEVLLWMNGPGESVSVPNEAPNHRHACSARAMQRCAALTWEDSRFQSLVDRYPRIGINIYRMLAIQLAELEQRFREIATEKVATRLSFALVRLAERLGTPVVGGVEIALSRLEMAQMIGTTLFTVSRILTKWSVDGFVAPRRDGVIVYDTGRLLLAGGETE
jgi:CRP/FNR family transcriptional regulator, nitrogen oxide reductase regulator